MSPEMSKVFTRAGLVRAFGVCYRRFNEDPQAFTTMLAEWAGASATEAEFGQAAADYFLKVLRSVGGVATLGTAEGSAGGRPIPPGLVPEGYVVRQPEVVPDAPEPSEVDPS